MAPFYWKMLSGKLLWFFKTTKYRSTQWMVLKFGFLTQWINSHFSPNWVDSVRDGIEVWNILISMRSVFKIPAEKLAKSEQIFWETGSQSRAGDEHGLIFLHFSPLVNTGSLFQWLLQLAENPRIQRLRILFSRRGARCQHDAIKIRSLLSRTCSQQGAG